MVIYHVWFYYRRRLCFPVIPKCIQDKIASGKAQRILDAFPEIGREKACFLALVADIITGEDLLKPAESKPEEA